MKTIRTTLRIEESLKKAVEQKALNENTTFQKLFNDALRMFINDLSKKKSKEIIFLKKAVDKKINNLTRKEFYDN